jgi:hypothetical protein
VVMIVELNEMKFLHIIQKTHELSEFLNSENELGENIIFDFASDVFWFIHLSSISKGMVLTNPTPLSLITTSTQLW